jgi:hypothetical protein
VPRRLRVFISGATKLMIRSPIQLSHSWPALYITNRTLERSVLLLALVFLPRRILVEFSDQSLCCRGRDRVCRYNLAICQLSAIQFLVHVQILSQSSSAQRESGEYTMGTRSRENLGPHARIGAGGGSSSDGSRCNASTRAQREFTLQQAPLAFRIHDEHNDI